MTTSAVRRLTVLASIAVVAGPLSTSHAILDKTRFVAHLGVAYYAFHHWVLAPYRAGRFASGAAGRTAAFAKGGLALLFAAHEVNVAEKVAHTSHDPVLQKLDGELVKLKASFTAIGNRAKAGQLNDSDIQSLTDATTQIGSDSAAGGHPIRDVAAPIPGL
ncbi:hypothetical protein E7T09_19625 [Deinococcus sp. KSM4-11]|uniref:hypothetical protein n=1 Tax=Deinococcus sp. KSM4-11 TaxID=2568654 RepID=UPI0010A30A47|nr:hypothetical protein [Deinococcus sp. KSM4-11]THF84845.1 hypothetical protein E7T09_19625 [Deinococcus sp. KSM4-11]